MKYILIKRYPGSPKLGTVYTRLNNNFLEDEGIPSKTFMDREFSNHWQEVVEKDYEILSIKSKTNSEIKKVKIDIDDNNKLFLQRNEENQYFLHSDTFLYIFQYYNIHSIKRLSDGEIFTIGDKIFPLNKICEFETVNNELKIWQCDTSYSTPIKNGPNNMPGNMSWLCLKDIKKYKQPLFTTEDGVDIFEGDTIYGVSNDWKIFSHFTDLQNKVKSWGIKPIFSTKEKVEEYVLLNKPCLSLNDIEFAIFKTNNAEEKRNKLKNLVKSKIKQSV